MTTDRDLRFVAFVQCFDHNNAGWLDGLNFQFVNGRLVAWDKHGVQLAEMKCACHGDAVNCLRRFTSEVFALPQFVDGGAH